MIKQLQFYKNRRLQTNNTPPKSSTPKHSILSNSTLKMNLLPPSLLLAFLFRIQAHIIPGYQCPTDEINATGCRGPTDCLYRNPKNCNRFIQCNNEGVAYDMPCPAGLHFNEQTRICDCPENANCEEDGGKGQNYCWRGI